jgi:hypothetical protein
LWNFFFLFSLPIFFFAPATVCQFLFRAGLPYTMWSLLRRCDDCCCVLYTSVYNSHRLGVCWSLKRARVSCCFGAVFPLGAYSRTSGRASCSFTELYCPMWCGEYRRLVMCVSVMCRFWKGNIHGKITW